MFDVIACYLRFTDKYLLQRQREDLTEQRLFVFHPLHDFNLGPSGCDCKKGTAAHTLKHIQFFQQLLFQRRIGYHALYFLDIVFHLLQILGKENAALMQKPHMVADILQFP